MENLETVADLVKAVGKDLEHVGRAKRGRGNPSSKAKLVYKDVVCAFDIETSTIDVNGALHSFMYVWQFAIDHVVYVGRCWDDYTCFLKALLKFCAGNERLVCYVHNLSYEFQFLSGVYPFENENVFAVKPHKVLKAVSACLEYRCSMLHSNMSLARWTQNLNVVHKKLSGDEFDYKKIRYPWTPLEKHEIAYAAYDVLGVVECIKTELYKDGDTLYKIPLTSTGYVRRDVKRAMKGISHRLMYQLHMEENVYLMLKRAFRGGDTHANRYFVNRKLENVHSWDRSSSYPDVMLNRLFPMSKFLPDPYIKNMDDVIEDIYTRERACLCDIAIYHYKQSDRYNGFPYLSLSKCRNVSKDAVIDNGRVLSADYLETTVTDIDLKIILHEIDDDSIIVPQHYMSARYGKLPKELTDCVESYYKGKTELKNVPGMDYFYMKSKNKLNSIYGLSVQDPCKDNILYDEGEFNDEGIPLTELLDKYYKTCFMSYAWGIWVTAWARFELRQGLWLVGRDGVYCDTDSVKFVGDHDFSVLNRQYLAASTKSGACASDPEGVKHYMGVFEYEGTYQYFATLGAKKYVYIDRKGKLHITIAGVNKSKGAKELSRSGGIEAFLLGTENTIGTGETVLNSKGFIFKEGGGNELIYNMDKFYTTLKIDGHKLDITRNVVIKDSTYQLGVARDYKIILEGIEEKYLEEYEYQ